MKIIKAITPTGCANGACPSLLLTVSGMVLVQGIRLPANQRDSLPIPSHEDLVAIPRQVFDDLVADYQIHQGRQNIKSGH